MAVDGPVTMALIDDATEPPSQWDITFAEWFAHVS